MNISYFEEDLVLLQQVEFTSYLDPNSIRKIRKASSGCKKLVDTHISQHWILRPYCCVRSTGKHTPQQLSIQMKKVVIVDSFTRQHSTDMPSCIQDYVDSLAKHTSHITIYCESIDIQKQLPQLRYLKCKLNSLLDNYMFPSSLTHLCLAPTADKTTRGSVDNLPTSITHLTLQLLDLQVDHLPTSLTHLSLIHFFMHKIDHLPPFLTHLYISSSFNEYIDHLPSSLTHLHIGNRFNKPVDYLPCSLKYLYLGYDFDQPIDNLPYSLTHLYLNRSFSNSLDNLPTVLYCLTIAQYRRPIDVEYLPKSLVVLRVPYGAHLINKPVTIKRVTLNY